MSKHDEDDFFPDDSEAPADAFPEFDTTARAIPPQDERYVVPGREPVLGTSAGLTEDLLHGIELAGEFAKRYKNPTIVLAFAYATLIARHRVPGGSMSKMPLAMFKDMILGVLFTGMTKVLLTKMGPEHPTTKECQEVSVELASKHGGLYIPQ